MGLRIRLARAGAKKRPFYHIVVADVRAPRDGRFIERLGVYNPLIAKDAVIDDKAQKSGRVRLSFDEERVQLWLSRGAQPSDRVARFLETIDIVKPKKRNNPQKAKPKAKAQQRLEDAQKAKDAAETPEKDEVVAEGEGEAPPKDEVVAEDASATDESAPAPSDASTEEASAPAEEASAPAEEASAPAEDASASTEDASADKAEDKVEDKKEDGDA